MSIERKTLVPHRAQRPPLPTSGFGLPADLLARARVRLGRFALVVVAIVLVGTAVSQLFLVEQPQATPLFITQLAVLLLSLAMWLLARGQRLRHATVLALGLGYEILQCLASSVGETWTLFRHDGATTSSVWISIIIVAYPLIIPSPPRITFVAAVFAAAMAPLGIAIYELSSGTAVPGVLYERNTFYPAVAVVIAYFGSRVVHGITAEVAEARRVGVYELVEPLGQGGMGIVYRASHAMLQRPTAVKLLLPDRVGADNLRRFEREVQLTAKLTHPNTITIFDYGRSPDGIFYYAMELVDGATLDQVVQRSGAMPAARVLHILHQVAGALAEAHASGLIHRDVKPQNIMLCKQGGVLDEVKVLDFGLVKHIDAPSAVSLTGTNVIIGTPQYMPPEAIKEPEEVDGRADLYALGAVGFYLLVGRDVFETIVEICSHHLLTPPPSPSEHAEDVPTDVSDLVQRCLAKQPDARPSDAVELRREIEACHAFGRWRQANAAEWWATDVAELVRPAGLAADES